VDAVRPARPCRDPGAPPFLDEDQRAYVSRLVGAW
jgi:hypothetical protein